MNFSSIGDLANSLLLNRQGYAVRSTMNRLSTELTTGLKSNVKEAVRGDYAAIADWEASISRAQVREKTLSEHLAKATTKGEVLAATGMDLIDLANSIDLVQASKSAQGSVRISENAKGVLEDFVNRLNTKVAGQSVFSGVQTEGSALQPHNTLLSQAKTAIGGAVTVSDVYAQLDAWLNDPLSGYSATIYTGAPDDAQNVRLDDTTSIAIPGRGDDDAVKSVMRGLIVAGLATDTDLAFGGQMQAQLLTQASSDLRNADSALTDLQASIGYAESRIEAAKTGAASQIATFKQLRLDVLAADPYETATKLQSAELQLEKIYALTARSARMSLMEYLR